jgi:WD40 repeat protein
MRVIDAFDRPVQGVAVSADGRLLAAITGHELAAWDWSDGRRLWGVAVPTARQVAFSPDGRWLVASTPVDVRLWESDFRATSGRPAIEFRVPAGQAFAGGVGFTPDGKHLVASQAGSAHLGQLVRWSVPGWQPVPGFDLVPPYTRLAISRDGQFLAGISPRVFDLRYAASGGLNVHPRGPRPGRDPIVAFSPDSGTCAYGWDAELRLLDSLSGNELRRVVSPDAPFWDAAFTGSGRHLGTADGDGVLRLWDTTAWKVSHAYDWNAGPLTCLAFTADGVAGVCGTASGQLVLFDLDE